MRTKTYIVNIAPLPWARARICGPNTHKRHFFDPQSNEKLIFGISVESQHNGEPLFNKAISVDLSFFLPLPLSVRDPSKYYYHTSRGDLDNYCKYVLDAIKGVCIVDDRLVAKLTAVKLYDKKPRTEFVITELDNHEKSPKTKEKELLSL